MASAHMDPDYPVQNIALAPCSQAPAGAVYNLEVHASPNVGSVGAVTVWSPDGQPQPDLASFQVSHSGITGATLFVSKGSDPDSVNVAARVPFRGQMPVVVYLTGYFAP